MCSFVACVSYLTVDLASLWRLRGGVREGGGGQQGRGFFRGGSVMGFGKGVTGEGGGGEGEGGRGGNTNSS